MMKRKKFARVSGQSFMDSGSVGSPDSEVSWLDPYVHFAWPLFLDLQREGRVEVIDLLGL
jgi:hypothetical protein